jgi:hypothetical protein
MRVFSKAAGIKPFDDLLKQRHLMLLIIAPAVLVSSNYTSRSLYAIAVICRWNAGSVPQAQEAGLLCVCCCLLCTDAVHQ